MPPIPPDVGAARAAVAQARLAFRRGDRDAARALLERVPALLAGADAPEAAAAELDAVALKAFHDGNLERCMSAQTAAIAVLRRMGDRRRVAEALIRDAGARMVAGRPGVSERLAEAHKEAETIGDIGLIAQAATTAAMEAHRASRPAEALEHAAVGTAAGRRAGAWSWVVTAEGTGAAAALSMGDPHACIEHTTRAIADAERQGLGRARIDLGLQRVRALAAIQEHEQAGEELAALASAAHPGDRSIAAKLAMAQGIVHRAAGRPAPARAALEEARARFQALQDPVQVAEATAALLELACSLGDAAGARAQRDRLRLSDAPRPIAALGEARAAAVLHAPAEALAAALEATRIAAEASSAPIEDEARVLAVRAARGTGDLARALALCEDLAAARAGADHDRRRLRARGEAAARRLVEAAAALDRDTAEGVAAETARALRAEHGARLDALAHTARNRLAAVAACGDLLALPTPPRSRDELVDRLHNSVAALGEMLDEAATRARDPGAAEHAGPTPLAPLAYRVETMFGPRAAQKGIDLQVRVRSVAWSALPPTVLRDAAENLVSNALKFCDRGDQVRVIVDVEGGWSTLSVQDSGPGIPHGDQDRLFQPRSRLAPRPTGGEPSSGLGLWLTRNAITHLGGQLEVESEPGEGSTFRLVLPEP